MIVKLLIEHHYKFLSLKGDCRGSSESTLVKMSNCWKSHAAAQLCYCIWYFIDKSHMGYQWDTILRVLKAISYLSH